MATDAGKIASEQAADEVVEPVFVRAAVGVGKGDDLTSGGFDSGVAGSGKPEIFLTDAADCGEASDDFLGVVGRAIVHEDDLVIGIVQFCERAKAGLERASAVETGNDHGNPGRTRQRKIGSARVQFPDLVEGFFWPAFARGQAESPVFDLAAPTKPIIGETVDDSTGESGTAGNLDLISE